MSDRKLDRISGWVFVVLGLLVSWGAWRMPRFQDRGASIFEAPGLTPGVLGLFLALCGLVLALRRGAEAQTRSGYWDAIAGNPANRRRCLAALGLTLGYGAGLFGRVPFAVATTIFLFLFILTFERLLPPTDTDDRQPTWRVLAIAALIAVGFSLAIHWVFVRIFLVQLP